MKRICLFILLGIQVYILPANPDSLWNVWSNKSLHDTVRLKAVSKMAWKYYIYSQPDSALSLGQLQYDSARAWGLEKYKANGLNLKGAAHWIQNDFNTAIEFYNESHNIYKQIGDLRGQSNVLNNLGAISYQQGSLGQAMGYFRSALLLCEQIGHKQSIASCLLNMGMIYEDQKEIEAAKEHYERSLELFESFGDKSGAATCLSYLGILAKNEKAFDQAIAYYERSLQLQDEINDMQGKSMTLTNLGNTYRIMGDCEAAVPYFRACIRLVKGLGRDNGIATPLNNIAACHFEQGNLDSAEYYGVIALRMSQDAGVVYEIEETSMLMWKVYRARQDYKAAMEMYELHVLTSDSINSMENKKEIIRQEMNYAFEKEQLIREQEDKEAARILAEETSRRNNLQYSLIFLGILLFFGVVLSLGFIKVSPQVAEGLIFFAFLILFEFLLVLGDPFVERVTGGEPIYKLLANALLAGLIFPAHAFFEKLLKRRLVKIKRG